MTTVHTPARADGSKGTTTATTGSPERPARTPSPFGLPGPRSSTSSPISAPEPVYDPFSGSLAGVALSPTHARDKGRDAPAATFDQTKDDLWSHLARIRGLQSEIAGMHLQMESIGTGEARGTKRAVGGMGRARRATEEWEDPGQAEDQRKTARDAEFANLAEAFNGRRTAIDGIMNKARKRSVK